MAGGWVQAFKQSNSHHVSVKLSVVVCAPTRANPLRYMLLPTFGPAKFAPPVPRRVTFRPSRARPRMTCVVVQPGNPRSTNICPVAATAGTSEPSTTRLRPAGSNDRAPGTWCPGLPGSHHVPSRLKYSTGCEHAPVAGSWPERHAARVVPGRVQLSAGTMSLHVRYSLKRPSLNARIFSQSSRSGWALSSWIQKRTTCSRDIRPDGWCCL